METHSAPVSMLRSRHLGSYAIAAAHLQSARKLRESPVRPDSIAKDRRAMRSAGHRSSLKPEANILTSILCVYRGVGVL
jgi:hypothetical protein